MPHVGTWIEILSRAVLGPCAGVVPHVGTWIEIHPLRRSTYQARVVPHVGTWIEMPSRSSRSSITTSCLT